MSNWKKKVVYTGCYIIIERGEVEEKVDKVVYVYIYSS